MARVIDVYNALNTFAPEALAHPGDNSGLLIGRAGSEVTSVLVSLDITGKVAEEASAIGANLIVSHHPVFFSLSRIVDTDPAGRVALSLAERGIAAVCMHTNIDDVKGGINDILAEMFGLIRPSVLKTRGIGGNGEPYGTGRWGSLPGAVEFSAFAELVKRRLGASRLRAQYAGRKVSRVAFGSGACSSLMREVIESSCDTFVTGDVKHSAFLEAAEFSINLIDAGHFPTENVICPVFAGIIGKNFPGLPVRVSESHSEPGTMYF